MLPTFERVDTDSLFIRLGRWIENQGCKEQWDKITDEEKIKYIKRISLEMEKYIDERIFNETQLIDYNSQVKDFKISFKQEIIAKTALFIKKKKYSYWLRDKEGAAKDEMSVTGLEIVRSDSSEAIRPRLKEIMELIMMKESDVEIKKKINEYRKELLKLTPAELAANIGINNIKKYIKKGGPIKGTPWHVKGVYNYRMLLKYLDIKDKYEEVHEGQKAKVVYVKQNPWNVDTITFHDWPEEFNEILQFDKKQMVEKFFIKKIRFLLDPLEKEDILDTDDTIDIILGL